MKYLVALILFTNVAYAEQVTVTIPDAKVAQLIQALEHLHGPAPVNADTDNKKLKYYIKKCLKDDFRKGTRSRAIKQSIKDLDTDL